MRSRLPQLKTTKKKHIKNFNSCKLEKMEERRENIFVAWRILRLEKKKEKYITRNKSCVSSLPYSTARNDNLSFRQPINLKSKTKKMLQRPSFPEVIDFDFLILFTKALLPRPHGCTACVRIRILFPYIFYLMP